MTGRLIDNFIKGNKKNRDVSVKSVSSVLLIGKIKNMLGAGHKGIKPLMYKYNVVYNLFPLES